MYPVCTETSHCRKLAWHSSSKIISCAKGRVAFEICLNCAVSEFMVARLASMPAESCGRGWFAKLRPWAMVARSLVRRGDCTSRAIFTDVRGAVDQLVNLALVS